MDKKIDEEPNMFVYLSANIVSHKSLSRFAQRVEINHHSNLGFNQIKLFQLANFA